MACVCRVVLAWEDAAAEDVAAWAALLCEWAEAQPGADVGDMVRGLRADAELFGKCPRALDDVRADVLCGLLNTFVTLATRFPDLVEHTMRCSAPEDCTHERALRALLGVPELGARHMLDSVQMQQAAVAPFPRAVGEKVAQCDVEAVLCAEWLRDQLRMCMDLSAEGHDVMVADTLRRVH